MYKSVSVVLLALGLVSGQDEKLIFRVFQECTADGVDTSSCFKLKIAGALDRATRARDLEIFDGVHLVSDATPEESPMTENELEASLPRSLDDKEAALDEIIMDKISSFIKTRSIQFKLAEDDASPTARGMEEGRKKKRGGALLAYMLMSLSTLIPLKLGTLALLAGKALIISKLALALAAIVGLKKLLSGGEGHESSYQVIHAGHGHKKRSIDSDLPYRAYLPRRH
uniref:Structural maintenance of chromosomes protein 1 n=1 Tax=Lygus hesperus TaxID=30085 RepID=A0A0A9XFU0_LYGHE